MTLAGADTQTTVGPIDIVQAQGDDFVRAQAKPNEQQEHGAVGPTADGTVL